MGFLEKRIVDITIHCVFKRIYIDQIFKREVKLRKKSINLLLILFLALTLTSLSLAQRQTGSIRGTVSDEEGLPLPGASVTVSGPAMLGTISFITSDTGLFRFPALPPGLYKITVEMSGFNTKILEGILVSVGKTTSIDVLLETTTLTEEVTVTAVVPAVDVTSSKTSVNYDANLIENIPVARSIYSLINTAPGVIPDSTTVTSGGRTATHGSTVRGESYAYEGFLVTDPLVSGLLIPVNFDTFDEVEIEVSGHPAEVGQVHGSYINVVTKSGGNKFSGLVQVYYTGEDMVSSNFTPHQIETFSAIAPKGPTGDPLITPGKTVKDLDASANLGGPLVKDKLWFFAAYRYFNATYNYTGFNDPATRSVIDAGTDSYNLQAKLTFQINSANKFTANYYRSGGNSDYHPGYIEAFTLPEAVPDLPDYGTSTIFGIWNWIINQNTFLDLRAGYLDSWYPINVNPDKLGPQDPALMYGVQHVDLVTGFTYGGPLLNQKYDRERLELLGSLTRFADNLIGGSHEFKLGVEFELSKVLLGHWFANDYGLFTAYTAMGQYDLSAIGLPFGYLFPMAVGNKEDDSTERDYIYRWSAYVQDSFTIGSWLTINAGLRWDLYRPNIPEQTNTGNPYWDNILNNGMVLWLIPYQPQYFGPKEYEAINGVVSWSTFSPRLGLTFDPFGDGKTSIKASYSKYYEPFSGQISGLVNPNYWHALFIYWYDLNINNVPDLSDYFIAGGQYGRLEDAETGLPDIDTFYDKDIRPTDVTEIVIGIEREVLSDFAIGVNYIRKWAGNIIEKYNRIEGTIYTQESMKEPGPDGDFGTSDDISFPVFVGSGNAPVGWLTNIDGQNGKPKAERKYQGLEFIINKRLAHSWQLFGSVVFSKSEGHIGLGYDYSYYGTGAFEDPNYLTNRFGRLDLDRPLIIKLAGTYTAPFGFNLSFYYTFASGTPYNRVVRVNGLAPWSAQVYINTTTPGTERLPSRDNLDLRIEKSFNLGPGRVGLFLDIFNALNSGYISYNNSWAGDMYYGVPGYFLPNANYLNQITGLSGPRVFKASVRYTF